MYNPNKKKFMTFDKLVEYVSGRDVNVHCDSRKIKAGDVFVAIKGSVCDGHDFIPQAQANGAKYIVCAEPWVCETAETVVVENPAKALAILAQASYGDPAEKLTNLAVTGTNGKTSVCFMVRSIIQTAGRKCGLIGTIVYDTGGNESDAPLTTPDSIQLAGLCRKMVDNGAEFMAIEASSHALSQDRLAGINFTAAAFTNLTGDHLDYHLTKENYLAAKTKLFENLSADSTAVLNRQSPESESIAKQTRANVLWYSIGGEADILADIKDMQIGRTEYVLKFNGKSAKVVTELVGEHNISNQLAAAGLAVAAGFDLKIIAKGLSDLKAVPGRLESVETGRGFSVLVDYAHTDDALRNVLKTLKPLCTGKLTVLFGCGGDRDKTKRPRMAEEAESFADSIIVTSDNPRTESPDAIIADIIVGFTSTKNVTVITDRTTAIQHAVNNAGENDIILIAGKGHETYQVIGTERIEFDDRRIVIETLKGTT